MLENLPPPAYRVAKPHTPAPAFPPPPSPTDQPRAEPGWIPPGGISSRWRCIVIHHSATTAGGARRFDAVHRAPPRNWDELGYHFVIGNGTDTPDGYIEVGPRWTKQKHGAHCKTPDNYFNDHGIGICLVGDFEHTRPTPRQMAALERLVRFLQQRCQIPTSRVFTHGQITGHTACPGRNFDLAGFRRALDGVTWASAHR